MKKTNQKNSPAEKTKPSGSAHVPGKNLKLARLSAAVSDPDTLHYRTGSKFFLVLHMVSIYQERFIFRNAGGI